MTKLRIVSPFPERPREPGMMWRYPDGDAAGRECWWIVLPSNYPLNVPGAPSEVSWRTTDLASKPPHEMWSVSGTPPYLTVTPSIDVERWLVRDDQSVRDGSYWHGFITNGELVTVG